MAGGAVLVVITTLLLGGCSATRELRDFTSDGCSLFPDGKGTATWSDCCIEHDRRYWRGGTAAQRHGADVALRDCVLARTGNPLLARGMYRGVRMGGGPLLPFWFRWGYGWEYGRGYVALTQDEEQRADGMFESYLRGRSDAASCTAR